MPETTGNHPALPETPESVKPWSALEKTVALLALLVAVVFGARWCVVHHQLQQDAVQNGAADAMLEELGSPQPDAQTFDAFVSQPCPDRPADGGASAQAPANCLSNPSQIQVRGVCACTNAGCTYF